MPITLIERLRSLSPSEWMPNTPATSESVAALEEKYHIQLPADYRELLLSSSGGGLYGDQTKLNLETVADLFWHNEDPRFTAELPGMFVIGDDNGDAIYYYDPADLLGKGAYALFQVDLNCIGFSYSKYAASSLTDLVNAILSGEEIWEYPYLGPLDHPDRAI